MANIRHDTCKNRRVEEETKTNGELLLPKPGDGLQNLGKSRNENGMPEMDVDDEHQGFFR
jgi:hypothetical protein